MSETQTQTPAGWYPNQAGVMQWWDGHQWTQHTQPANNVQVATQAPVIVNQRKAYKTSHGFHLLMSIITLGLWLPVWLIVGMYNAAKA